VAAPPNLPNFMQDLIYAQALTVNGTEAAGFIIEPDGKGGAALRNIAHVRQDNSPIEVRQQAIQAFAELVKPCLQQGKDGALSLGPAGDNSPDQQYCLVTLLRSEGNVVAVSAVITRCLDEERAYQRLDAMRLIAGFFDLYNLRRANEAAKQVAASHQDVLQFAASVATADGFLPGANNLCNELAAKTGAARVSIGWVHGTKVKLKALSHTEEFDKKQQLSVQIVRVMEEAVDQEEVVQYDPAGQASSANVTREAAALSKMESNHRVISLPLRKKDGEIVGVLTLEFAADKAATPQETTALAVAADLLAPQLFDRYQNDRWLITKAGLSVRDTAKLAIGPKHMLAKTIIIAVIAVGWFVTGAYVPFVGWLYTPMHQVKSPFQFASEQRRTVTVPLEQARITRVFVKPGDNVRAGDTLVEFNTDELRLKLESARSEQRAALAKARAAREDPKGDKLADALIAEEEANKAGLDAKYWEAQVKKATVTAPIDGVVTQGDLRDRVGQTMKLGDQLVEIAPPGQVEIELFVNERDIQQVAVGSKGELATNALPGERHRFVVTRVVPSPVARESKNAFRVYAQVDGARSLDWTPGMEGEARVDVKERSLLWSWTHRLIDFVRIKLWM
jgi:multidrug resistance efflux pump